jgi:6-pyruvoyltetrahydropterin/6-carboxytetrahydropterin synthase
MLICREFTFDAAHHLTEYKGKCENVHGHTYRLRVCVEEPVKDNGLALDFVELKRIVNETIINVLDHEDLNKHFDQPSCENVLLWIWNTLKDELNLAEIRLWESPDTFAVYRGE